MPPPPIGWTVKAVETPSLFLDLESFYRNVGIVKERVNNLSLSWRPLCKHKSPALGTRLIDAGAVGISVSTVDEAQIFAHYGFRDLFIVTPVADAQALARLQQLASQVDTLRVAVENVDNVHSIARAMRQVHAVAEVLVSVNVGRNTTGISVSQAVKLARAVFDLEQEDQGVKFAGITCHEPDSSAAVQASHALLAQAKDLIIAEGIDVPTVSGALSVNYVHAMSTGVLTEVLAGDVVTMDNFLHLHSSLRESGHDTVVYISSQIVSVLEDPVRAIADAGFRSLGFHPQLQLSTVMGRPDLEVYALEGSHVYLRNKDASADAINLRVGDKVAFVANSVESVSCLFKEFLAVRGIDGGVIEAVWPIIGSYAELHQ